jgi:hypothetical protein
MPSAFDGACQSNIVSTTYASACIPRSSQRILVSVVSLRLSWSSRRSLTCISVSVSLCSTSFECWLLCGQCCGHGGQFESDGLIHWSPPAEGRSLGKLPRRRDCVR